MPSNLYVTADELASWIDDAGMANLTDASGNDRRPMLETLAEAASRQVDADCGRIFYRQVGATRRYYPDITGTVHLVDLIASVVPTIVLDIQGNEVPTVTLATTDYVLLPRIEQSGVEASARYQAIKRNRFGGYQFFHGYAVDVTGDWGYIESDGRAPSGIRTAVLIMASRLFMRRQAKLGRAVVLEAGISEGLSKTDPDYLAQIEPYVLYRERWEMA